MVSISFLGGCREVGRSAILIKSKNGAKCILDYGIRFRGKERLPQDFDTNNLKAITVTHCHVDHSGAIPYLYKSKNTPFYTNSITLRISEILIKDMLNIGNFSYPFGKIDLKTMVRNARFLENSSRQKIDDNFYITFYNAGHIPGSVSILVEVDNKRILYTGDINAQETNLVERADPSNIPEIDTLIIESTYASREHPKRDEVEKQFVESVIDITENGGKVLIPAFGVARSQEALMILEKYNYNGKIFIDGLARKICNIYMQNSEYLKNFQKFKKSLSKAQFISEQEGRSRAKKSNAAIIAPSGMLKGGASINFIKSFLNDPFSAIYLVGYQAEGSPGRKLLEEGVFEYRERGIPRKINENTLIAKCNREYFNFSSHSDHSLLHKYVENLTFRDNERNIFCIHGDNKSTTYFAKELNDKDYNSIAPEIGEVYKL
ncbi:MAG: MBL fold metallo-hydrolase [Promethearchaeota archaeon]